LLFFGEVADVGDLREAVNEKVISSRSSADSVEIDQSVFDDIMQEAGRDADLIETHLGQNVRDLEGWTR
jgi:hypothetical protein